MVNLNFVGAFSQAKDHSNYRDDTYFNPRTIISSFLGKSLTQSGTKQVKIDYSEGIRTLRLQDNGRIIEINTSLENSFESVSDSSEKAMSQRTKKSAPKLILNGQKD